MPLNLITDPWIPVVDRSGNRRIITPWHIADPSILRPDWPRTDLNIACLELLIGLVFMADPPVDIDDWEEREGPDPDRLRAKLAAYEKAFNLTGERPLFLQDYEPLEGTPNAPDILFIDSAGANAVKNNADLTVHRERYSGLDLPLAAMALYTLQAHAPSGGAGNRTSMRGGGPIVTLVDPENGLWPLVWANVPYGVPSAMSDLPWMGPTRVSDKNLETTPPPGRSFSVESFFGAPRRFRLIVKDDVVTGVIQKRYGTKYAFWMHPLSPYYRQKAGDVALPVHPKAGAFGYRHWLGIIAQSNDAALAQQAYCLVKWPERSGRKPANVIVAGWAMDKMKPLDFTYSSHPLIDLPDDRLATLKGLIDAADKAAVAMREALAPVLAEGEAREAEREGFYLATESAFVARLEELKKSDRVEADICADWLKDLKTEALRRFNTLSLPALDQRETSDIGKIVAARRKLAGTFTGHGKFGKGLFEALGMELPVTKGKAA